MIYTSIDIIFNPNSTGPSREYATDLKQELTQYNSQFKPRLHATKYAGHAEELAYGFAKSSKHPLIISSSGDGGYHEVVNGAIRAQLEGATPICAVLAAGNANDHSRTLTSKSLVELIKADKIKNIDLLKLTITSDSGVVERYAHSYIGLGLTPMVATELNKTNLNALKEAWIVVKTFYGYRPFKIIRKGMTLELDSMVFANIGEMAKVLTLSKKSRPDDGKFEVITFQHAHKFRLLRKLAAATVKGLDAKRQYEHYEFKVIKKMPAQLDGEVVMIPAGSHVVITSEHQMLSTLVG